MNRKSEPVNQHVFLDISHDESEHVMGELMRMFDHIFKEDQVSSASGRPPYSASAHSSGQRVASGGVSKHE